MYLAAVLAVAHSPFAGGLPQVFEVGAIWRIWDSVRVVSVRGRRGNVSERGWAVVERTVRVRRVVIRVGSILMVGGDELMLRILVATEDGTVYIDIEMRLCLVMKVWMKGCLYTIYFLVDTGPCILIRGGRWRAQTRAFIMNSMTEIMLGDISDIPDCSDCSIPMDIGQASIYQGAIEHQWPRMRDVEYAPLRT